MSKYVKLYLQIKFENLNYNNLSKGIYNDYLEFQKTGFFNLFEFDIYKPIENYNQVNTNKRIQRLENNILLINTERNKLLSVIENLKKTIQLQSIKQKNDINELKNKINELQTIIKLI